MGSCGGSFVRSFACIQGASSFFLLGWGWEGGFFSFSFVPNVWLLTYVFVSVAYGYFILNLSALGLGHMQNIWLRSMGLFWLVAEDLWLRGRGGGSS
jgi:hypothetical protein